MGCFSIIGGSEMNWTNFFGGIFAVVILVLSLVAYSWVMQASCNFANALNVAPKICEAASDS